MPATSTRLPPVASDPRLAFALALAACGAQPDAPGPCLTDLACRGERICHEGRCRFEEEVRAELATAHSAGSEVSDGSLAAGETDSAGTGTVDLAAETARAAVEGLPEFLGGGRHTGRSAALGPASAPSLAWTHHTTARIYAAPVVGSDGTLYVGSRDGSFVALSPDGTLRWRYAANDAFYGAAAVADDGTIVVGNHDGSVVALTPLGQLRWRRPLGAPVDGSVTIDRASGTIYASADGLYALSATGEVRWHHATAGALRSPPALHPEGLVLVGTTDGRLVAVRRDGALAWQTAVGASIDGGASIADDGTIVVGTDLGHVVALRPDGTERWRLETGGDVRATPAIAPDGTIVVGSDDRHVWGIAPDGTERFRVRTGGRVRSSAAIDAAGRIFVGSQDDFLYALAPDGALLFRHALGHDVDSSPALGRDGTLYVGADDGGLYALR